jgi:hypothetical protein
MLLVCGDLGLLTSLVFHGSVMSGMLSSALDTRARTTGST